jgi:Family of unknown function (DUF6232)
LQTASCDYYALERGAPDVGKTIVNGGKPPRWGLQQEQSAQMTRRVLWFGAKRIALDDIQSINAEEVRERPVAGVVTGACIFVLCSVVFAFGVFEYEWRERFLLGTLFLAFLGMAGFYDSTTLKAQRYFEVKIATGSQGVVTFASADASEVQALLGALAGAGVTG